MAMEQLADHVQRGACGALVTIDEFHNSNIAAARDFAHAFQDVVKIDGKPVMLVVAGLPSIEESVLADQGMTFFQRISRIQMDPLTSVETARALREPIEKAGGVIDDEALAIAVVAASGYPFMVQLVGYHSWEGCVDPAGVISRSDIRKGVRLATKDMHNQVFVPIFRDLPEVDRRVLTAMSSFDIDEVKLKDLARILGKTSNYLDVYTNRLCQAEVIRRSARGRLQFMHITMRDWLCQRNETHDTAAGNTPRLERPAR